MALVCLAFMGLTACSRLDIALRWVDVFIAGKVDDYFDLNSQQKKELKKSIQLDLKQIQAKLLPQWIHNFKEIEKDVNSGSLEEQKVAGYFASFMSDAEGIKSYFADTAVQLVGTVDDSQMKHFRKSFSKKAEEDLAKAQNNEKLREEYKDKYIDYFAMFLGTLTKDQEKSVDQHLQTSCFPAALKVKNNEYVFEKFMKESDNKEKRKQFVREFYVHPERFELPEYKQAKAQYQESLKNLITDVLVRMTPEQKVRLKKNLIEKTAQLEKAQGYIRSL